MANNTTFSGVFETLSLTPNDLSMLARCGIPRDLADAAGLFRVDSVTGAEIVGKRAGGGRDYAGIVFPYVRGSQVRAYRLRRDHPDIEQTTDRFGNAIRRETGKYLSAPGDGNLLYFPPIATSGETILITEGEKKTLALAAYATATGGDYRPIGLSGVWNWRGRTGKALADDGSRQDTRGPIPDLNLIEWDKRRTIIIFDANVKSNPAVYAARDKLTRELLRRGAVVFHVDLPELPGVNGVDDLLGLPNGADLLSKLIETATTGDPAGRVYNAGDRDLVEAAAEVLGDLAAEEQDRPGIFVHAGVLSRVSPLLDRLTIEPLTEDRLSYRLAHLGRWAVGRISEPDKRKFKAPPRPLIKHILAAPAADLPFPILHRTVTTPVFTPTGSLLTSAGYDRASGIYYLPTIDLPPLPATITETDIEAAKSLIFDELLPDFPFGADADRANAVALLVLPFVRDLISGPTPLFMIEAPSPGSGKGLLAASLLAAGVGAASTAVISHPQTDDEWSKRLTGAFTAGNGAIQLDNLRSPLDSAVLASALTAPRWNDRIIGTRYLADVPVRAVWVATGNNIALSAEILRRCVRVRLEPATDRPEDRADFRHSDQLDWVNSHRPEIVNAALTLCRWWVDRGRPAGRARMGSYESFAAVVGGILDAAGIRGFLANVSALRDRADTERAALGALCNEWFEWAQRERRTLGVTAADLYVMVGCHIEGLPIITTGDVGRSFAHYLSRQSGVYASHFEPEGRVTRMFRIQKRPGLVKGKHLWQIDLISEE